jgi:hypothetical protein
LPVLKRIRSRGAALLHWLADRLLPKCLLPELFRFKHWREVLSVRIRTITRYSDTDKLEGFLVALSLMRGVTFLLPGNAFLTNDAYAWYVQKGLTDIPFGVMFLAVGLAQLYALVLDCRDFRRSTLLVGGYGWLLLGLPVLWFHPLENAYSWPFQAMFGGYYIYTSFDLTVPRR